MHIRVLLRHSHARMQLQLLFLKAGWLLQLIPQKVCLAYLEASGKVDVMMSMREPGVPRRFGLSRGRSRMPLRRAKCRTFECRWHLSARNDGLARSKMKLMVGMFKPLLMGLSRTNTTTFVWVVWLMTILYYCCHSSSLWCSIWLALHSTLRTFS